MFGYRLQRQLCVYGNLRSDEVNRDPLQPLKTRLYYFAVEGTFFTQNSSFVLKFQLQSKIFMSTMPNKKGIISILVTKNSTVLSDVNF